MASDPIIHQMPSILLTNHYNPEVLAVVQELVPPGFRFFSLRKLSKHELIEKAEYADYFLASGRLAIDRTVIKVAHKLKMIQRTGVGTDSLDLAYLKAKNIPVYVNKGVNAVSVAEHTVMLMLSVLRKLPHIDAKLKQGIWQKNEHGLRCHSLQGKVVGLIGLGNIGLNVVRMLAPFQVRLLYNDLDKQSEDIEDTWNLTFKPFYDVLKEADILSLHCPLNDTTRGMIGRKELGIMKKSSYLVNTARGQLVDEKELVEALKKGHISGAALDVFSDEPLRPDNPLLDLDNVVLTPHVSGLTLETFKRMMQQAFETISSFEAGALHIIDDKRLNF